MSLNEETGNESVASRKLGAAESRRARKAARDPRNRLFSDSSDEVPKGILKNSRIPTKRSVSECVDDLSQIMADLDLNIHDLPKATDKFCLHHQFFNEEEEEDGEEEDDEEEDSNYENRNNNDDCDFKNCDCNFRYGDRGHVEKPKKSVRFDEHVYETVFFASRLYDRRSYAKYHFSSRHHPPSAHQNKSKKSRQHSSKSESKEESSCGKTITSIKPDNSCICKLSKSQRSKQSKKDKKKRLNKRDNDVTDTGSDDQGYCSSMHSFSD